MALNTGFVVFQTLQGILFIFMYTKHYKIGFKCWDLLYDVRYSIL